MGLWSLLPIVPPDTKMLIWDFDGTLAYCQGKWSGALVDDDENEDDIPSGLCDFVNQFTQRSGGDFHDVAGKQREIVWGNDTGAG